MTSGHPGNYTRLTDPTLFAKVRSVLGSVVDLGTKMEAAAINVPEGQE